jgi:hypothetical protein
MTPEEKGRFCGSCQKTVIDFSNMNDRQLADYFKKPKSSVCGRFKADQLDRDILIYKKRVPWVNYFFTIVWPAFVLLIKGCGQKEKHSGQQFETTALIWNDVKSAPTVGLIVFDASLTDSASKEEYITVVMESKPAIIIDTIIAEEMLMGDVVENEPRDVIVDTIQEIDTTLITSDESNMAVMGKLVYQGENASSYIDTVKAVGVDLTLNALIKEPGFLVFPNPIVSGQTVKIKILQQIKGKAQLKLINTQGQEMTTRSVILSGKGSTVQLELPTRLTSGNYFLQIILQDGSMSQQQINVMH